MILFFNSKKIFEIFYVIIFYFYFYFLLLFLFIFVTYLHHKMNALRIEFIPASFVSQIIIKDGYISCERSRICMHARNVQLLPEVQTEIIVYRHMHLYQVGF